MATTTGTASKNYNNIANNHKSNSGCLNIQSTQGSSENNFHNNKNNTNNNNNNNNNNKIILSNISTSSSSLQGSLIINHNNNFNNSDSSSVTVTADAATVAIAKDMLQLHHGSALSNNNNSNSSNGNNIISSNNNNNNNTISNSDELNSPANNNSNDNNNDIGHLTNQNNALSNIGSAPSEGSSTTTTTILINAIPAQQQQSNPPQPSQPPPPPEHAVGYLKYNDELLYITESCTIIGRNSSTSHVHFHVAENNLVSRKHFQILFDTELRDFFVQCLSKNGIFVDDFLQRRNADPLKLSASCYFRFPSTEIRIQFESFLHINSPENNRRHQHHSDNTMQHRVINRGNGGDNCINDNVAGNIQHVIISSSASDEHQMRTSQHQHLQGQQQQQQQSGAGSHMLATIDNSNVIYSPLKISIPKKEQKSPYLSPTGTISAANSCPTSPRQGFHQNQNNYNNYNSNNLQNQQDLFQTPSTASYNHNEKPPYSYAQLIVQAISAAPDKQLTLSGIYSFIVKHYPYYRKETNKGWQNSIRHNLSLNRYFIKVARSQDEPGKGSFWRIDPDSGAKLIDHSYKKRRQRSSQGFRPSYGMPRSAPVSPSHMEYSADNSRESSPLQDIILQSAPGSPGMSLEQRSNDNVEVVYQQQTAINNNNNHQYSNSNNTYFVTRTQPENNNGGGGGGNADNNSGGGVGTLISLKRNHAMATNASGGSSVITIQQQQQQQLQGLHPDIIYEEMPADYSGNMDESDECDVPKRPKYVTEML